MTGFKKPTVVAREAHVKIRQKLGLGVPADPRRGFTDRMEFLSPSILIGYKDHGPGANHPTNGMKAAIVAGANMAKRVIRKANDEFAKISFLRKSESQLMTSVLATHFNLPPDGTVTGDLTDNIINKKLSLRSVGKHDRRWVIEKIRRNMLSTSFHLNTGIYLIDVDADHRDIESGEFVDPAAADHTTEAYVSPAKLRLDKATWRVADDAWIDNFTCGFRHGEMHVSFAMLQPYSALSYARIIIHEATHKYLNTDDHAYAHQAKYLRKSMEKKMNNADSYAWAAISLYCGSLKMATPADEPTDWKQCSKP